eukprot:6183751-Pleurochrysis_carterae.AAC.1
MDEKGFWVRDRGRFRSSSLHTAAAAAAAMAADTTAATAAAKHLVVEAREACMASPRLRLRPVSLTCWTPGELAVAIRIGQGWSACERHAEEGQLPLTYSRRDPTMENLTSSSIKHTGTFALLHAPYFCSRREAFSSKTQGAASTKCYAESTFAFGRSQSTQSEAQISQVV